MHSLFENLKKLYENELYESAIILGQLILHSYERKKFLLNTEEELLQAFVLVGNSFYYDGQYRQAVGYFKKAIQLNKSSRRSPVVGKLNEKREDIFSEAEIKFKCAKCLVKLSYNNNEEAVALIESLSAKFWSPKIHSLYGKLTKQSSGLAYSSFTEVLKECPLALDVVESLLEMGTKGLEMNSLIVDATHFPQCSDWLANYIEAHAFMSSRNYSAAIAIFKQLEVSSLIENHHKIVVRIGECYYFNGNYEAALVYLKRAHLMAPESTDGLMFLASLLGKKNQIHELEQLISASNLEVHEYKAEHWYVMALFLFYTGKFEKATYYIQKSIMLDPQNVEAVFFKAVINTKMQKYTDALADLRSVMKPAQYRFELYMGLSEIHVKMSRFRDAQTVASTAVSVLGETPRTLTLLAKTFEADVLAKRKIKSILKNALKMDENYLPAILMLVGIMRREGDAAGAIKLLKKHTTIQPNCKLLTILGDILNANNDASALEYYTMALKLDPNYRRASDGLLSLGKSTKSSQFDNSSSNSNPMMVEDHNDYRDPFEVVNTNNGGVPENDTLWYDVEIEINSN